ncbi:MAG: hypothetical protein HY898_10665 [Deltaproteobacteria bacterium]|nr:hypothetical protein [Deltaproteobacteria bacterium]
MSIHCPSFFALIAASACSALPPVRPPEPVKQAHAVTTFPQAAASLSDTVPLPAATPPLAAPLLSDAPSVVATPPALLPALAPPAQQTPSTKRSSVLPSGLFNPMPGGQIAGYRIDTGLDIAGSPREVFAIAPGTLDYSEPGHTRWVGPNDTANCVRIRLDQPIAWKGHQITHAWYAHLSALRWIQAEGAEQRIHVQGGELIGTSGKARGMPHLHLGLLLDGEVEQTWGTYLREDEIRQVLGDYRNGARLPQ